MATSNMNVFDVNGRIKKFDSAAAILDEFYAPRLELYQKRKANMIRKVEDEHTRLSNQVNPLFITTKATIELLARSGSFSR